MSAENITSSVHAFETSVGTGASFAEHLDHAVQSSPCPTSRPETPPSESSRTDSQAAKPKQASDAAPQAPRTPVTARSTTPQTKQNQSASGKASTTGKAQNSDPSTVQKDEQPGNARSTGSRLSDDSRNADGRQTGDEETPANGKNPFAQALAQGAASQSAASSTSQSGETGVQLGDASMPAALLALLQAPQNLTQAAAVQTEIPSGNGSNPVETDSSSTDTASATPSNLFGSLNFSTSAAAYQASLTNFGTSAQAAIAQPASTDPANSASQTGTPAGSANSLPSSDGQTPAPSADVEASSTDNSDSASQTSSGNNQSATASDSLQAVSASTTSASATTPTAAPVNQADASAVQALPSADGQLQAQAKPATSGKSVQAETAEPANLIKNLKLDASQHEAAKPALEQGLTAAAKAKNEPLGAVLQQATTSALVLTTTSHEVAPTPSFQPKVTDAPAPATSSDSESPALSTSQDSASGFTDDSTGNAAGDDSQSASASQGSNSSKSSGSPMEFLPTSAFNSDAVGGVAPAAVHAVASATLQSNTGFDHASSQVPATVSQSFNSAAQEKAFAAWQSVSDQVGRVVNTATLNALQNGTEMRVQLRTDAFGSMDIRATLEGGKVGAAIGVESAEAHNALLNQLPALQQSLNERQVQLDQISVVSSYGQSGTDFGTGSGKQNGDPTPSAGHPQQPWGPEQVSEPASAPVTEAWQPGTSRGRLSVRA